MGQFSTSIAERKMAITKRRSSPEDTEISHFPELRTKDDILRADRLDCLPRSANAVNAGSDYPACNERSEAADGKETDINVDTGTHIQLTYKEDISQSECADSLPAGTSTVSDMPNLCNNTYATASKDQDKPYRIMDPEDAPSIAIEDIPQPDCSDHHPDLVASANNALHLLGSSKQATPGEHNTQDNNMDIDDVDDLDPDGGVSLIPTPPTPPTRGSTACLGLGLTLATALPPPGSYSNSSTPNTSPSTLPTIQEESEPTSLSSEMDFTFDDDDMPPLEATAPSMPGMWPIFKIEKPFQTRYSPTSPSPLKNSIENPPNLPPHRSSLPGSQEPKYNGGEIDAAYSDDEFLAKDGEMKEQKEGEDDEKERVRVEWSNDTWPPDNPYERAFCERVCEEVARAGGFQRVYIRCVPSLPSPESLGTKTQS